MNMALERLKKKTRESARQGDGTGIKFPIPGAVQYHKWLSYIPDFMQKEISEIAQKPINELSVKELEKYRDFLEEQKVAQELGQFLQNEWGFADIDMIERYIKHHRLSGIKKSRLTEEEYRRVIGKIQDEYGNIDEQYINSVSDDFSALNLDAGERLKEEYDSFTMEEAFIHDFRDNLDFRMSIATINQVSRERCRKNEEARGKSEISASKTFTK
ncbi:MAG: hypothetical protein IKF82_04215 [Bacilli bacterium]|nr:hypothetical protein [Bacilli bacterium]